MGSEDPHVVRVPEAAPIVVRLEMRETARARFSSARKLRHHVVDPRRRPLAVRVLITMAATNTARRSQVRQKLSTSRAPRLTRSFRETRSVFTCGNMNTTDGRPFERRSCTSDRQTCSRDIPSKRTDAMRVAPFSNLQSARRALCDNLRVAARRPARRGSTCGDSQRRRGRGWRCGCHYDRRSDDARPIHRRPERAICGSTDKSRSRCCSFGAARPRRPALRRTPDVRATETRSTFYTAPPRRGRGRTLAARRRPVARGRIQSNSVAERLKIRCALSTQERELTPEQAVL
jgi:hypothetical protein